MPNLTVDRLRKKKERIIATWERRASAEVPSAKGMEALVLRDLLPDILTDMAERLSYDGPESAPFTKEHRATEMRLAKEHARSRARSDSYSIQETIFEFHILRQVLFQILEEDGPLPLRDRDLIAEVIEHEVIEAAHEFSNALWDVRQHFVDSISHDLRNPASSARMTAELITRRTRSPLCKTGAERIIADMQRIDKMIQSLLDVSRIRAGQNLPLKLEEFDLDLLVREIVAEYASSFAPGRFRVHANDRIEGHWSQEGMRRVIENLITNALKYGSGNQPVTISIDKVPEGVRLIVHNEGNPIPSDRQRELFTLYRRLEPLETKGWGLGLVLVKGIVEALGGKVHVESCKEKGTSFIVEIPQRGEESLAA